MKKLLAGLLSMAMIFSFSVTALAADFSGSAEADLNGISDKIVTTINECYSDKGITISEANIDFSQACKIYVDTNVFTVLSNDVEEIKSTLDNGNFIYQLPIQVENGTILVNLQKGLPLSDNAKNVLTEEEQQQVLDNVGKWTVSSTALYEAGSQAFAYDSVLAQKVGDIPEGTLLVGSLPIFQDVVALVPNENGVVESLVPLTGTPYSLDEAAVTRSNSEIFDYEQIKEYALNMAEPDSNIAGGAGAETNSTNYVPFVLGTVILVGGVSMILIFKWKNRIENAR